MRPIVLRLLVIASLLVTASAVARGKDGPRFHTVYAGQTLGRIAKRYNVTIAAICKANGISRRKPIRPGQKLVIPARSDKDGTKARHWKAARELERRRKQHKASTDETPRERPRPPAAAPAGGLKELQVAGVPVYYYEPIGPGRLTLRPVLMYLHGRGGSAKRACRRWARIARRLGWLACPTGPEHRVVGHGWDNNWVAGHRIVMGTLNALRRKYGRRVQLYGNTLIGFSEGAYVAMNVGVREPRAFNRWLILAAHSRYWGAAGLEELARGKRRLRRVYLITGHEDGVYEGTLQVRTWLRRAGVPVRISSPADMGHMLALETKAAMYRAALVWLERGSSKSG